MSVAMDHLAATGATLGDLQPAVAHEGLFEGGSRMIVPVDPPGQPSARIISGGGKALLAQIAFQQVGKARTGLGFVEAQPMVLAKALV